MPRARRRLIGTALAVWAMFGPSAMPPAIAQTPFPATLAGHAILPAASVAAAPGARGAGGDRS